MSNTRRTFLQAAAITAGLRAQAIAQTRPESGRSSPAASEAQVPKMKFGNVEISRLVCGSNPFYGYSHFNSTLDSLMTEWYTPERVCAVLHQCERFGINARTFTNTPRCLSDYERFRAEGGRMHLIVQGRGDVAPLVERFNPLAIYAHGEDTDRAFQIGELENMREWCKKVRQLGVRVGVGTHKPEVIARVEEEGWDVDFYAACVYNRTRTQDEWKQALNGEMMDPAADIYMRSDPPRMYKVIRQTRKPCFAFKILAAGRLSGRAVDQAFQTAFESIKPIDGVFVGMFPRFRDEVKENAERVRRVLSRG